MISTGPPGSGQEIRVRPDPVGGEGPLSGAEHRDALTLRRRTPGVRKQPASGCAPRARREGAAGRSRATAGR